jgi:hypothetical protein
VFLTKYHLGDQINKNELGAACNTNGERTQVSGGESRERGFLKDVGVHGKAILKYIFKSEMGAMDWIKLVQYTDRWRVSCECGNEPSGSIKCGEFLD